MLTYQFNVFCEYCDQSSSTIFTMFVCMSVRLKIVTFSSPYNFPHFLFRLSFPLQTNGDDDKNIDDHDDADSKC